MPHTKKAGPKQSPVVKTKYLYPFQTNIVNKGIFIVYNGEQVAGPVVRAFEDNCNHHASLHVNNYSDSGKCSLGLQYRYDKSLVIRDDLPCRIQGMSFHDKLKLWSYHTEEKEKNEAKAGMREIPKMSIEQSHALSRRMFARTAEDMAQELYDDAE